MKKNILLLLFILIAHVSSAQLYYETYPIAVTQTSNGTQFRLECSVYDSALASTVYYNTAYFDSFSFTNNDGMLAYNAENCIQLNTQFETIIYDYLIHQFQSFAINVPDCGISALSYAGSGNFSFNYVNSGDYDVIYNGYYDLLHHLFVHLEEPVLK